MLRHMQTDGLMVPVEPSPRPRIGISRCLLGDEVRYDGGHKRNPLLVDAFGRLVEWVPVCPEVEVGMGTPREPIHLVASSDGAQSGDHRVRLLGVPSARDWTHTMEEWTRRRVRELAAFDLSGFVLKADSPSCGVGTVPVHGGATGTERGHGLFAQALINAMPDLPIEDERRLADPWIRQEFLTRVFARHRARHAQGSALPARVQEVHVIKVSHGVARSERDAAATEEPLEIRLNGASFVVIMRTPGADRELAAGFLLAERIITGPDDLGIIRHCTDPEGAATPNVLNVTFTPDASTRVARLLAERRMVTTNSACGVCGRKTIDDLLTGIEPLAVRWKARGTVVVLLPEALRKAQPVFEQTGGLHAAALFDREGRLVASAEDVGRHNAVDKVIGAQVLTERLPLEDRVLFVSGRASYEIVQKALVARIPLVASVSAPSSLAIDLARQGGVTLVGFVRGGSFNVYTAAERIEV
jgi:FdhD protein